MSASPVGIDDLSVYVPQLYFPIEDLATARDLSYPKLSKGLGLLQMAVADAREDAATMAANAVLDLMHKNDLDPNDIGRLYLGTESALDGAKPTATYVLDMLQDHFTDSHGGNCFLNCDVVDLTFACIGAVDALQNSLEWAAAKDGRIGIVVASDEAKYEMNSPGEYTQGAGAVAMVVKQNPRLLAIDPDFGVATRPAHDFFKPNRKVTKREIINEVLDLLPDTSAEDFNVDELLGKLSEGLDCNGVLDCNDNDLYLHKVTPVFDGPYSNDAYQARIREALQDYRRRSGKKEGELLNDFSHLGQSICVFAYGSGSKSKVFGATLQAGWEEVANGFDLKARLENRQAIDYPTYEKLHRGALKENVANSDGGSFFLADVHDERNETEGVRHYGYASFLAPTTA